MKIRTLVVLVISIFFSFVHLAEAKPARKVFIFDHTSTGLFDTLSDDSIKSASKTSMIFRHASVGDNIHEGLEALKNKDARYDSSKWELTNRGNDGGWSAKIADFVTEVKKQNKPYVYGMKFCFIDPDAQWPVYRKQMEALQKKYPNKIVVWTTIPLVRKSDDRSDDTRYGKFNAAVRKYVKEHGGVLLDIADIESGGAKKEVLQDKYASDDSGHLNEVGSLQVAKALWVMMAKIAEEKASH